MERCKFLIIGGGVAADAAARGIYETGAGAAVIVVSDESDPPYDRPALSKALWKGAAVDTIWRHTESMEQSFVSARELSHSIEASGQRRAPTVMSSPMRSCCWQRRIAAAAR